ncbi:MAG: hypothetical protein SAJ12_23915 [Jaaginema sp. PMC 1079.18]|nr:hypothetical protein [Jaaginema sp. PMC 1080.18]MEC4854041.1 hypothetical protein [Jaaginema sp. PMC 1079.18]MEC4869202.1 hypothetical protein [Jaaginema sp. PMC 1078.18]
MFYYYGRKKQIAKYYPSPNFETIVEPFAGSAAYSLYGSNWKKNVILIERDERISKIWDWLINKATPSEIKSLPDLKVGERSSEFFHIIHAATKMAFHYKTIKVTHVLARNWKFSKKYISENLFKIKHWRIINGDYTLAPNIEATWFIDPPYKEDAGKGYRYSSRLINYEKLAAWSKERSGEVIFCEGHKGDYLPFEPLLDSKGVAGKTSKELIYYQSEKANKQLELFPL